MDENENTIEWKVRGLVLSVQAVQDSYHLPRTKVLVEFMLGGVIEEFNVGYGCLRFEYFELWSRNGLGSSINGRKKSVQRAHWGWCHGWRGVAAVRGRGHKQPEWRQSSKSTIHLLHSHILTAKSARLSGTAIIELDRSVSGNKCSDALSGRIEVYCWIKEENEFALKRSESWSDSEHEFVPYCQWQETGFSWSHALNLRSIQYFDTFMNMHG